MAPVETWYSSIAKLEAELASLWLTRAEFDKRLAEAVSHPDSPVSGLAYRITFDPPFQSFTVQAGQLMELPDSQTVSLNDSRGGQCQVRWSMKVGTSPSLMRYAEVAKLFIAWWKPELRTPSAGLPDLKRETRGLLAAESTI